MPGGEGGGGLRVHSFVTFHMWMDSLTRKLPPYLGHLPGLSGVGCDCSDVSNYKKNSKKTRALYPCFVPFSVFATTQLPNPLGSKWFGLWSGLCGWRILTWTKITLNWHMSLLFVNLTRLNLSRTLMLLSVQGADGARLLWLSFFAGRRRIQVLFFYSVILLLVKWKA